MDNGRRHVHRIPFFRWTGHHLFADQYFCQPSNLIRNIKPHAIDDQRQRLIGVGERLIRQFPNHFRRNAKLVQVSLLHPPSTALRLGGNALCVCPVPDACTEEARLQVDSSHTPDYTSLPSRL